MPSKPTPLDPEKSAGYQVRRCHRRFDRLLNSYLARHDLKTGFWYYLRILWIQDGVSQKYLSDMTNVAENTTASIINAMVNEGLVTRERDKQDKRKFCIRLTERGRALEGELMHYAAQINRVAAAGIDPAEIDLCLSVLRRMSENLADAFADLSRESEELPSE
ncbi:MarR family winged helix-turn-helix transcriptional regulator [Novosphingobium beihaiensis]|uniref:MarR family winged helix-turn-helix transcriptional regulator n=1 Tax=Novosphingobium beihaiensis TaxID=2930389 RepID=A0ABT0BRC0_9SPHN|nr:MarR family winged helix-turn-helix transcriptional regulator [Novosphingobium beihaiensis]MCJ2187603.1 MarR family winged helix-turn-helix transcriptional regulator [Novosphingobium beihaiensis]